MKAHYLGGVYDPTPPQEWIHHADPDATFKPVTLIEPHTGFEKPGWLLEAKGGLILHLVDYHKVVQWVNEARNGFAVGVRFPDGTVRYALMGTDPFKDYTRQEPW